MSKWSGFYRKSPAERLRLVAEHARLSPAEVAVLQQASALPLEQASQFIENAVATFPLPLGIAVHFKVDGREVLVPMAVEESSVVAAASHAAKLARDGFRTEVMAPVTIGQVELRDVADLAAAARAIERGQAAWRQRLNQEVPRMVQRGGGVQRIVARIVQNRLVVHLHVDTRDAMGANTVNTLCEAIAPDLAEATGGTVGLRILSNLATERLATARCSIPFAAIGGRDAAQAIVEANEFARIDPYRATTHNKGIMNGIDPVLIATGNDWRAVEAGAHAYAARDGHYAALTTWRLGPDALEGELTIPMQLGTVGGVTSLHPMSRVCLRLMGDPDAQHLAAIVVAVGLAQNLAALRALSQEGIQQGHMELHARNLALQKSQGDAGARNRS